ncbi:hypothetical protein GIB67_011556 [Kingdonia uniflora]|uniref:Uncharacterized protein n=1 Tax=Kingdonia uniflora TaxID=39325 RepID=A0A7J7NLR4_9MAGN|nr:hypothetical protein GIB67_011556 [Kingdonia uniflora]
MSKRKNVKTSISTSGAPEGAKLVAGSKTRRLTNKPSPSIVNELKEAILDMSMDNDMLKLEGKFRAVALADPEELQFSMELEICRLSHDLKGLCLGFGDKNELGLKRTTELEKDLAKK